MWGSDELFPLPQVPSENVHNTAMGSSCRKRMRRRCKNGALVQEAIDGLNWLARTTSSEAPPLSNLHEEVHADLYRSAALFGPSHGLTDREAFCALLKGKAGYCMEDRTVASLSTRRGQSSRVLKRRPVLRGSSGYAAARNVGRAMFRLPSSRL